MDKILVIIRREYLQRVRTRAFLIGTILTPALLLVFSLLPVLLATRNSGPRQVVTLDKTGDSSLFDSIDEKLKTEKIGGSIESTRIAVQPDEDLNHLQKKEDIDRLMRKLGSERGVDYYNGYLILQPGILDGTQPQYYSENPSDFITKAALTQAINAALLKQRLARAGLVNVDYNQLTSQVELEVKKIGAEGVTEEKGQTFAVAFVMLFFIYITILMYGIMTMRGVIEEKQSRIVEVVISSVKPFNMLMGKLIGIGLVGLTQYLIWVLAALGFTVLGVSIAARMDFPMPSIPASLLVYFVVFFVLGYFLFATLYAVVGSMVSSEEDAQQMQYPVTILIAAPMMIFWLIVREPNSPLSTVISMIPFFAPTLMMMRIAIVSPPLWQIMLSIFLMIAAIVGVVWIASKIYRITILMYGKKPSLAELGRWIRYA